MSDRYLARRDRLRATLTGDGPEALLVSAPLNVRYLTGFTGDSTPLIVTRTRDLAVSDPRYAGQLAEECPGLEAAIRPVGQKLWAACARAVSALQISRLGFEVTGMLVSDHESLREALPTVAIKGVFGRVEALRAIKDDHEIESIRRAVRCAERAFAMFRAGLVIEETEIEAANVLEQHLRRCGASSSSFAPIVAAGPRSALPHASPTAGGRVGEGGFVLVDWGAVVEGYRSDLTRLIVTGTVGEEFARAYRVVLTAQGRAIAAIRPGARASDVDAQARRSIDDAGFAGLFGHGLGHGLGLALHEAPALRPDSDDVLRAGMVVTVEPGLYRPGWGGIRIEDDVLVTADGAEVLSRLPRSLDALAAD